MRRGDDHTTFIVPKVTNIRSLDLPDSQGPFRACSCEHLFYSILAWCQGRYWVRHLYRFGLLCVALLYVSTYRVLQPHSILKPRGRTAFVLYEIWSFFGGEDLGCDLVVMTLCRSVPWRLVHYIPPQHSTCEIWRSHSGVADVLDLVGYDTGIWWVIPDAKKDFIALDLGIKQTLLGLLDPDDEGTMIL